MVNQDDPGLPSPQQQMQLPTLADLPRLSGEAPEATQYHPPAPAIQQPEQEEEPSAIGFLKNTASRMKDVVTGLGQMVWKIPDTLIRGGSEWVKYIRGQRDDIGNDFSGPAMDVINQGLHENMKRVVKSTMESYAENYGSWQGFLENTYKTGGLDVFLDALTVADLGASAAGTFATKAARAASLAGNASKAAEWAAVASKAEQGGLRAFLSPLRDSPTLAIARKVPLVDQVLTSLKLTPESAATARLLRELQSWHDAGMGEDMRGIVKALAGVPDVDIETTLRDVARGEASAETLAHPASKAGYQWIKKWVEQITNDKIDRGALTEAQARNAPMMMVRNTLSRIAFGKMRAAGALSDVETKALNLILESTSEDQVKNVLGRLDGRGTLRRILEPGEVAEITQSAKPGSWLRDRFAPYEVPTLNVPGQEIRGKVLRSIQERVELGQRAQEVLDAYAQPTSLRKQQALQDLALKRRSTTDYVERLRMHDEWLAKADESAVFIDSHIANVPELYDYSGHIPLVDEDFHHELSRAKAWDNHLQKIGETPESIGQHLYTASGNLDRTQFERLAKTDWPLTNAQNYNAVQRAQHELSHAMDVIKKLGVDPFEEREAGVMSRVDLVEKARAANDMTQVSGMGGRMTDAYRNRLNQLVASGEFAKKDYLQNWQRLSEKQVFDTVQKHLADTGKDPTYYHMIHQQHLDAASPLLPNNLRGAKQAWMKARTGADGEIGDMRVILPTMSKQWRDFQKVSEFFRRFTQQPFVKDITEAVRAGTYEQPKGTQVFSHNATSSIFYKDVAEQQARLAKNIQRYAGPNGELTSDTWRQAIVNGVSPNISADLAKRLQQTQGMKIYEIPRDVGDLLSKSLSQTHPLTRILFDTPTDILRTTSLYMNPFWYAHTIVGHAVVNLLSGQNPFSFFRAGAKNFAKIIPDELKTAVEAGLNVGFTQAERKASGLSSLPPFRNLAEFSQGVENFYRSASFMDNLTKEAVKRRLLTTGEAMFASNDLIAQKIAPLFAEAAERGAQRGTILGIDHASAVQAAIDKTNSWLGNYNSMHPLERDVLRRIVPFWSFVKNMNLLALRLPVDRPMLSRFFGQVGELHREQMAHAAVGAMDDEHLPDYLEGHVPVGYDSSGHSVFVSIKGLNPFQNYGALFDPKKLVTHTNPIIKATLEYFGGRDQWSKRDLKSDEPIFDYSGRAWKVRIENGQTSLVKDVPGESWIARFASQYPQVQVFRNLVDGYQSDDKGIPVTKPFMDQHGNWQYPTNFLDSALKLAGISIKRVDPADLAQRETMLKISMIKGMEKHLKDAPPEYRSFIIDAITRAGQGRFRAEGY